MMRGILILGLLVGMVGTAGAETTWVYPLGNGQPIDISKPCDDIGATALTLDDKLIQCRGRKGWTQIQMICERKMQSAMEAMEPYILKGMTIREHEPDFESKVWKAWEIYKQWAEAKQCWRRQP